jgi:hypothetical protein
MGLDNSLAFKRFSGTVGGRPREEFGHPQPGSGVQSAKKRPEAREKCSEDLHPIIDPCQASTMVARAE